MKIFLASPEVTMEQAKALLITKTPNVLTSYFYTRTLGGTVAEPWYRLMKQAECRFIDSGAFTLRTSVMKLVSSTGSKSAENIDYDKYLDEYITWLKQMKRKRLADVWVEIDIGAVTSESWVVRQREKFLGMGLGAGLINVWHSGDHDWDYWLYLLKEAAQPGRSRWVAVEGNQIDRDPLDYIPFLKVAFDMGVRVHCFRMTASKALAKYPFYSVDSSSWTAPVRTGGFTTSSKTGIVKNSTKQLGSSWRGANTKKRLDGKRAKSDLRLAILVESAASWLRSERRFDALWKKRGVDWDKQLERVMHGTTS